MFVPHRTSQDQQTYLSCSDHSVILISMTMQGPPYQQQGMGSYSALVGRLEQLLVQPPSLEVGSCGDGMGMHLHIT